MSAVTVATMRAAAMTCREDEEAEAVFVRMVRSKLAAFCLRGRWGIPPDEWRAFDSLLGPSDLACVVAVGMMREAGR